MGRKKIGFENAGLNSGTSGGFLGGEVQDVKPLSSESEDDEEYEVRNFTFSTKNLVFMSDSGTLNSWFTIDRDRKTFPHKMGRVFRRAQHMGTCREPIWGK